MKSIKHILFLIVVFAMMNCSFALAYSVSQFQVVSGNYSWEAAKLDAQSRGGHLASIPNQEKLNFILANFSYDTVWIGGFQPDGSPEPAGGWTWITGEPWDFTNWSSSEPNNVGNEMYLEMFSNGKWNDNRNPTSHSYLLEFSTLNITNQPVSIIKNIGDTSVFNVGATNVNPITYQWSKDGITLNGKTNATLTIANVQQVNIGLYNVRVSDAYGNIVTSSNATLSLNGVNSGIWSNLVAYYPFNGNPNDASGYGNDGSGFNLQFTTNGILGQAAILDGSAGITVPESSSLHLGTQFTISCWVRIANWDGRNVNTGHPIISAGGIVGQSETAFGAGLTEWSSDLNFNNSLFLL